MPLMDGFIATSKIKQISSTKVIIIGSTALLTEEV